MEMQVAALYPKGPEQMVGTFERGNEVPWVGGCQKAGNRKYPNPLSYHPEHACASCMGTYLVLRSK